MNEFQSHPSQEPPRVPHRSARTITRVSAGLCALLVMATLGSVSLGLQVHTPAGGWGMAMVFAVWIPLAAIPVGIVCFVSIVLATIAGRANPTRETDIDLWFAVAPPIVTVVIYVGISFLLLGG
jgi:hypothetical protein